MPREEPRPTDTELRILQTLWNLGPATVREVHKALSVDKPVGYTTALKMLQVMTEKGLVLRDDTERPHRYRPRLARGETQRQLLRDLIDRAFGGSPRALVLSALPETELSEADAAEIARLLDDAEPAP
ncbi:MAG: BlaI/MecI/CopY family transcriptional regulator [Trueperaceae bacterium]|nr:BlaI/MecI/CopY family transcriptional regulator [Trueperaceae bacterium]